MTVFRARRLSATLALALAMTCAEISATAEPTARFAWSATGPVNDPLQRICGVRVAPDGKIWVSDSSDRFFIFDPAGTFLEIWGSPGSGPGQFRFHINEGNLLTMDFVFLKDGSFYVGDAFGRIQSFDAERRYRGEWGPTLGGRPVVLSMTLRGDSELLLAFLGHPDVYRYDFDGRLLGIALEHPLQQVDWEATGRRGQPTGLAIDSGGRFFLSDSSSPKQVRIIAPDGAHVLSLKVNRPNAPFSDPQGLALDDHGNLFVADQRSSRVVVFDPSGAFLFSWGSRGSDDGKFNWTSGLALDGKGAIYVGDWYGFRVQKFVLEGLY